MNLLLSYICNYHYCIHLNAIITIIIIIIILIIIITVVVVIIVTTVVRQGCLLSY